MKISGVKGVPQEILLAQAVDNLRLLVYSKTKDAEKGRNFPEPISAVYFNEYAKKKEKETVFASPEDFERAKAKLLND